MSNPPKILYAGMDGLDVAFQGRLSKSALEALARAKEDAQRAGPVLIELGPGRLPVHVRPSGAQGGYRYAASTGEDGETWFFKASDDPEQWNIRVSVNALALVAHGYEAVRARLWCRLDAMGAQVLDHSIGRVDFAWDFATDRRFGVDPLRMVTRQEMHLRGPMFDPDETQQHYRGRKLLSYRAGHVRLLQVAIYDKRADAIKKQKDYMFDTWGVDRDDNSRAIWRLEIRFGKDLLYEDWNIRTFEDLDALHADAITWALGRFDYKAEGATDTNVSRQASDPIFAAMRATALDHMAPFRSGVVSPPRVIRARRTKLRRHVRQMIVGLSATYSVLAGIGRTARDNLPAAVEQMIRAAIRQDEFGDRCTRAADRYWFIAEDREDDRPPRPDDADGAVPSRV